MKTMLDWHTQCHASLPALVGGNLSASDAAAVIAHVQTCRTCRAEFEFARRIHQHFAGEWGAVTSLLDAPQEQASFDRLWTRIAAEANGSTQARATGPRRFPVLTALAAMMLLGIGSLWYRNAEAPDYRTRADSSQSGCGAIRVRIAEQQVTDAARLFDGAGAHIVDGPGSTGLYTLDSADRAESLRVLRALPEVLLAEPADC